jgi:hypothetical protein
MGLMEKTYRLFPLLIQQVSYPNHHELKDYITNNVMTDSEVPTMKNGSGTMSLYQKYEDKSFFKDCVAKPVQEFHEWCKMQILLYARDQLAYDMDNIIIVGSWINLYGSSGQDIHSHANSFFSANYFLNYDEEAGHKPLRLWSPYKTMNPARPYLAHNRLREMLTPDHYDYADPRVEEGDMLIWPSFLSHSVDITAKNALRQTISMNAMPTKLRMHSYSFEVKKD